MAEFSALQSNRLNTKENPQDNLPEVTKEDKEKVESISTQVQAVKEIFLAERARAYLWEYKYLNYYLVRSTQVVLDWLVKQPQRITFSYFDSYWNTLLPDPRERIAIIQALENHHLISIEKELITVTEKGKEYHSWRGPLLPIKNPQ